MADGEKTLLRLAVTGSVDDGKSTLMGRLLYDLDRVPEDQWAAVVRASARQGLAQPDLSLLFDGLAAEREQGITIDVAYRYFETARRKFIIADTPGHEQYTRNMVTGASTADLAVILIDARKGVLPQTRRHAVIISLLRIPHLVLAVNKMDLVGFAQDVYDRIVEDFKAFCARLQITDIAFIPVAALTGDQVVVPGTHLAWYRGPTLLQHLEDVYSPPAANLVDLRFPVQGSVRQPPDFRGLTGRLASGVLRVGDEVAVLPSGLASRVRSLHLFDRTLTEARAPQSVTVTLADELDISRGDMLVRPHNLPHAARQLDAMICWLGASPCRPGAPLLLKHTTRQVPATVTVIQYRLDIDTLHRQPAGELALNEIGRVALETHRPLFFDPYSRNRKTGSFILIDPVTNNTVAAGMINGPVTQLQEVVRHAAAAAHTAPQPVANLQREGDAVPLAAREQRQGHRALVVWLTGLSGAGKSTLARLAARRLFADGWQVAVLDGDNLRHGLCAGLGFSAADREENIRRAGEAASLLFQAGHIVLGAFISPFRRDRDRVRALVPAGRFLEVHVRCALDECRRRDPKQLYRKAAAGQLPGLTGIDAPYEPPTQPELVLPTDELAADAAAERLLAAIRQAARPAAAPPSA